MANPIPHNEWRQLIDFEPQSIVLFGSYARNDYSEESDIDILLLSSKYYPPLQVGKFSVSTYSKSKLLEFANKGSLFVLHLIKEAKILEGENILEILNQEYSMPDFAKLEAELLNSCKLLQVDNKEFLKYSTNIIGVQKFILRSILYSQNVRNGNEIFNIQKVLTQLDLTKLGYIFDRNFQKNVSYIQYLEISNTIEKLLGTKFGKSPNSIEATIFNNFPKKNLLHTLGMSILKIDSIGIDYPKLILDV